MNQTQLVYRLFTLDENGTLWQLETGGWTRGEGSSFSSEQAVRYLVYKAKIPYLRNKADEVDTFIAAVDESGMIVKTSSILGD